ncbi:thiol reductant ABC exporter subunit CydC [Thioclava sp. L04-15]|uniref:thiol reductant ABC exporter subunit CydC n=1 Tax=Thioclava sp. L04-15 TaxID=1915318 RepID=UPI0009989046|nr:thiol reductant ABC exporter subunit CydC [Thioclava sp. L04-15]OOY29271.1 thiol reductant ABC exporter subunit CydC [Thioclava sp. L04-15]TNE84041.1 MAG: thiol reductant ABC exporter subunit CydC [Paracoccaceae bacterium]
MKTLMTLTTRLIADQKWSFLRGLALSFLVLAMGAALLGLSGWFVTAAAVAGITGLGLDFDFFRPSAGVRGLALGRAVARYGERLLTHDATLRALADLRIALMDGVARRPHEEQARLRGAQALNRLTSDVDALDGLLLRLVLPFLAAGMVQVSALLMLWWLEGLPIGLAVFLIYLVGGGFGLIWVARAARHDARAAETALQNIRRRALETMRARADLAVAGQLEAATAQTLAEVEADALARRNLEALDRRVAAVISLTTALAGAAALAIAGQMAMAGQITPARAAVGLFVALALAESLMLLRRGMAEIGRMQEAGARVLALTDTPERTEPENPRSAPDPTAPLLVARALSFTRPAAARPVFTNLTLELHPGETVFLTGPSGAGKSTALAVLAGLMAPDDGELMLAGQPLAHWPEAKLRSMLTMVPQRSQLIGGTIAENLALALPMGEDLPDAEAWAALRAVALDEVIDARGGLGALLGEGGTGLSGGQSKRLALARAALRKPKILLLDEPTEGLDAETARATLTGLRALLPESAFLVVSHRTPDLALATRSIPLG